MVGTRMTAAAASTCDVLGWNTGSVQQAPLQQAKHRTVLHCTVLYCIVLYQKCSAVQHCQTSQLTRHHRTQWGCSGQDPEGCQWGAPTYILLGCVAWACASCLQDHLAVPLWHLQHSTAQHNTVQCRSVQPSEERCTAMCAAEQSAEGHGMASLWLAAT